MRNTLTNTVPVHKYADNEGVQSLYVRLGSLARNLPNDEPLARMLASRRAGFGVLPACMGLNPEIYHYLLLRHFSGIELPEHALPGIDADPRRQPERAELQSLLLEHRANADISEQWIADIVVSACMGGNHLWQDLGLWSRRDLTRLIQTNFPALAAGNDCDMKWKKFFYKQLCLQTGIYTCRAPSCEVCVDYRECFGPED
ncbi:MAG TPA: nitrogen fixation protein NifQ [Gammaproteobacteria bacterium]|nr:nitrogen fixation protein NifQ [Gammaproteobacteria bacterium]